MSEVGYHDPYWVRVCFWPPSERQSAGYAVYREMFADYDFHRHIRPNFVLSTSIGSGRVFSMNDYEAAKSKHFFKIEAHLHHGLPDVLDIARLDFDSGRPEFGKLLWFLRLIDAEKRGLDPASWQVSRRKFIAAVAAADPEPGVLDDDDLEVYALLGEPSPFLWPDEAFLAWLEERTP